VDPLGGTGSDGKLNLLLIKTFKPSGIYISKPLLLNRLYALLYTSKSLFYLRLVPFTL
jgi:hypothetical protein